jgi:YgiT-type zinc finger domain-containing protein
VRLKTYPGRTIYKTDTIEIQNVPCTVCEECGQEQIGQRVQKTIDKLLEGARWGKVKTPVVVMSL